MPACMYIHCWHIIGTNTTESYSCNLNGTKPLNFISALHQCFVSLCFALLCVRSFIVHSFVHRSFTVCVVLLYAYLPRILCVYFFLFWFVLFSEYRWNDDHFFRSVCMCVCVPFVYVSHVFSVGATGNILATATVTILRHIGQKRMCSTLWCDQMVFQMKHTHTHAHKLRCTSITKLNIQQKQYQYYKLASEKTLTRTRNIMPILRFVKLFWFSSMY